MSLNLVFHPERCLGCKICALTCSWQNEGVYQPDRAAILIEVDEKTRRCRMQLDRNKCSACKLCIKECPGKALEEAPEEKVEL